MTVISIWTLNIYSSLLGVLIEYQIAFEQDNLFIGRFRKIIITKMSCVHLMRRVYYNFESQIDNNLQWGLFPPVSTPFLPGREKKKVEVNLKVASILLKIT